MFVRHPIVTRIGVAAVSALAVALGGCTAGSTGSATPTVVSGTTAAALATAGGSVAAVPVNGYAPVLTTGAGVTAGTSITLTTSTTAPTNAIAPSSTVRTAEAISGAQILVYVTMTLTQPLPANVLTGESLALPGTPSYGSNAAFSVEFDDITASPGTKIATVSGTRSGSTVTFVNGAVLTSGTTFAPTHTYAMMFYVVPNGGSATPTPAPTSSATPAPGASVQPSPGPFSASTNAPAATLVSTPIPTAGGVTGTAQFSGFSTATTLTLTSYAGLSSGLASPTTSGTVFFSEGVATTPAVTVGGTNCTGCTSTTPLTINPTLNVISAAAGKTFYAAECNATACPVKTTSGTDAVALTLSGSSLVVGPTTFADIAGFSPTTTWIVFYYQ